MTCWLRVTLFAVGRRCGQLPAVVVRLCGDVMAFMPMYIDRLVYSA